MAENRNRQSANMAKMQENGSNLPVTDTNTGKGKLKQWIADYGVMSSIIVGAATVCFVVNFRYADLLAEQKIISHDMTSLKSEVNARLDRYEHRMEKEEKDISDIMWKLTK